MQLNNFVKYLYLIVLSVGINKKNLLSFFLYLYVGNLEMNNSRDLINIFYTWYTFFKYICFTYTIYII